MPAIGIGLLLLAPTALAQQAVIDRCKETSSDADRIACLEAALLGRETVTAEEPQAQIDLPSIQLDAGPAGNGIESQPEASAPGEPMTPLEPEADPVGIGADQVIARNKTRDDILEALEEERGLKVASYDIVPYERLVIRLENGQVWRQSRGDKQRIRVDLRRNQTVDITESSLSGYKLRLNEMRRTIRVERVK